MIPMSTARIAGSYLCDWGYNPDPGNPACENVALPGFTCCPAHERVSKALEAMAAQRPMAVRIDPSDKEGLVEEALAAGCTAVEVTEGFFKYYNFVVTGPEAKLLPLLESWGYDDSDSYEVLS